MEIVTEQEVIEEDRHVVLAARQAQSRGFVAGVEVVEQDVGTSHPLVDVLRREIDGMIMIPEGPELLGGVAYIIETSVFDISSRLFGISAEKTCTCMASGCNILMISKSDKLSWRGT